jgi:8-oxo-dGTP diphosphatase
MISPIPEPRLAAMDQGQDQREQQAPEKVVVVGAAIVRTEGGGPSVLCARRSAPPAVAGRWEFPGGKVEAGESDQEAVVRECREELGVVVEAGAQIGGEETIDDRFVLRIHLARLLPGQPEPLPLEDHDLLEWVEPGRLLELDWLPADIPIVTELADLAQVANLTDLAENRASGTA